MTEPGPLRPVPGPPRSAAVPDAPSSSVTPSSSGSSAGPAPVSGRSSDGTAAAEQSGPAADRFADLEERPVAEHVAVFEAEHGRLQRELGTIDQL
jgi:hypothetical protein